MIDIQSDEICWPDGFSNIGGKTFKWVFDHKKEWVEFTAEKMSNPTKLFLDWKLYVMDKLKHDKKRISDQTGVRGQTGVREEKEETKDERADKEAQGELFE